MDKYINNYVIILYT